jgi:hypothetical protein
MKVRIAKATINVQINTFQRFAQTRGIAKNNIATDEKYINIFPGFP